MKITNSTFFLLETILIIIYSVLILFSLILQPINLILGILCILIIPGYNLLNILKPNYNFIQKLGYTTIFSLAIGNLFMFFTYIFLYDIATSNSNIPFFFNPIVIIISIQIFNIALITINYKISLKNKKYYEIAVIKKEKKNKEREKNFFIFFSVISCFIISLILLCISTLYSKDPINNTYLINLLDYQEIFTFFIRVPWIFYIFLIIAIFCLTYIVFNFKNHLVILICVSGFLYVLWILPYLQINNYFAGDSYFLSVVLKNYNKYGIKTYRKYSFALFYSDQYLSQRYVTSIFTSFLFIFATNISIDFLLWYIFPLNYVFICFFFYSTFQNFKHKNKINNLDLIMLTILAVLTPQFVKFAHSATTGVIGIYIFFILVVEYYNCVIKKEYNIDAKDFFVIILLFLFLCITHTEECIYFIIAISLFGIYSLFFHLRNKENDINKPQNIKIRYIKFGILISILLLVFYVLQEFFGWFHFYLNYILPKSYFSIVYDIYESTKVIIFPSLNGTFTINFIIIGIIIIGTISVIFFFWFIFTHYFIFISKFYNFSIKAFKKLFNKFKWIISLKFIQFLIFPLFYLIIIIFYLIYLQDNIQNFYYLFFDIILSFTFFIFHIFFFFRGTLYYEIEERKQNYFLISIISSSLFVIFFFFGNFDEAIYLINSRFPSFFIFFNLIIIQNSYFKHLIEKKKKNLTLFIVFSLLLATYYSLRYLGFG